MSSQNKRLNPWAEDTCVRFVRHAFSSDSHSLLPDFFKRRVIALHYADIPSAEPSRYKEKAAQDAMKRFAHLCKVGGLVAADYSPYRSGGILIGFVDPNSKI